MVRVNGHERLTSRGALVAVLRDAHQWFILTLCWVDPDESCVLHAPTLA